MVPARQKEPEQGRISDPFASQPDIVSQRPIKRKENPRWRSTRSCKFLVMHHRLHKELKDAICNDANPILMEMSHHILLNFNIEGCRQGRLQG
uniref:Uncharacterized protein n=1 Tax=Lepeophtheirus salmonis TaxID=72036 RepID=A0A0K2V929_LEPSM